MAENEQVKKLQQQLRSAQGRLRSQQNTVQETNFQTPVATTVTYAAGPPASATALAGNTCADAWIGVVAPREFTRHWSNSLPQEYGRVVIQYAFVCEITAGPYCDVAVDPRCMSPCTAANDAAVKGVGNFVDGEIVIPKGETAKVTFSLNGRQLPLSEIKKTHQRRLRTGTLLGLKNRGNPDAFNRARHSRRPHNQWLSEVQDDSIVPCSPSFCLTVFDDTLDVAPFRHGAAQPYNIATVKWCSLHYLAP